MAVSPLSGQESGGLTRITGVKVGHFTLSERMTGCTVILTEDGAVGGVDVRGGAPATRETDLLAPDNMVQRVHAIVLSGGSAFGLDAATGVVRFLEERQIGFNVGTGVVPIVPAASLFDLGVGANPQVRPDADCGYRAARDASTEPMTEGSVGAGAGATVGKLGGGRPMKSGIGTAVLELPNGLMVGAVAAVNAVGDVIDPATGEIIAGALHREDQTFVNQAQLIRTGRLRGRGFGGRNTTLVVVATNAALDKTQAHRVAKVAHDGLARAITPVHTPSDGDIVFSLALGTLEGPPDMLVIGALAADAVAMAIVRAVQTAEGLPGLPSVSDLLR
jgi:L-aminopeptidase/D-esterase-like protein